LRDANSREKWSGFNIQERKPKMSYKVWVEVEKYDPKSGEGITVSEQLMFCETAEFKSLGMAKEFAEKLHELGQSKDSPFLRAINGVLEDRGSEKRITEKDLNDMWDANIGPIIDDIEDGKLPYREEEEGAVAT
jgi:hypothetical protein